MGKPTVHSAFILFCLVIQPGYISYYLLYSYLGLVRDQMVTLSQKYIVVLLFFDTYKFIELNKLTQNKNTPSHCHLAVYIHINAMLNAMLNCPS